MNTQLAVRWGRPLMLSGLLMGPIAAGNAATPVKGNEPAIEAGSDPAIPAIAATPAVAKNSIQLKRVRVNARRNRPQQPPGSATVITGKQLEQQRIYRLEDLQQVVTGLDVAYTDPFDTRVTIRGIGDGGGSEINIGMPSSVGLFLDHVYLTRPGMMSNDLLDIDTTTVLKGPQGTLYGFNTTGGAIDIQTKKPTFTPEASIEQSLGQRGYTQSRVMVSGPLTDTLAGRLNFSHTEKGGYITNVEDNHKLGGSNQTGVRGQLLYQPSERLSLRFIGDYNESHSYPVLVLTGTHAIDGVDTFRQRADKLGANLVTGRKVALDDESKANVAQGGGSVQADLNLDNGYQLRSISSARYFGFHPHTADGLSIPLYANSGTDVRDRIWSQEFRLDSPRSPIFDYSSGVSWFGENMDTFAHDHYYDGAQTTTWYGSKTNTGKYVQRFGKLEDSLLSAFSQGTWHAAEKLDVTAGFRYSYEEKSGSFRRVNKSDFDSGELNQYNKLPAGMLNFTWFTLPNLQSYLTLAYGEKSGGLNISSGAAAKAGTGSLYIDPEKTRSVELGVKSHWLQRRIEFDTALFWSKVSDFQTTAYDEETLSSYLINAGTMRSRGIESRLGLHPVEDLSIDISGTFLDASYLDFDKAKCPPEVALAANAPSSCNLSGERVFNSPRYSYNTRIRYEWGVHNDVRAFAQGAWSWRGWAYGTVDNSRFTRIPAYGLLNFSTGLTGKYGKGSWRSTLWLNNALDKTYYRTVKAGDYGSSYAVLGEPRTLGITLGYDF